MSKMLDDLYLPDGKRLTTQIVGKPGGGKSFYLRETLMQFMKKNDDPDYRLLYICPKQEMLLGEKDTPVSVDKIAKNMRKNRVTIFYPNPYDVENEVDYAIELMFQMQQQNEGFTGTIVLDDAQTFVSSRRQASPALKRLALTGRSKGLRFVAVAHQAVFSKDLEGSTSYLVMFTLPVKLYHKDLNTRYGLDVEPYIEPISSKPYSFLWFDVTKGKAQLYDPIDTNGHTS